MFRLKTHAFKRDIIKIFWKTFLIGISGWIMSILHVVLFVYVLFFKECVLLLNNDGLKIKEKHLRSGEWDEEAVDFPEHWKVCQQILWE